MSFLGSIIPRLNLKEALLGISLGTGYMTSLRFLGPVGLSEILMFIFIFLLLISNGSKSLYFPKNEYGLIKLFMYFTCFFLMPVITLIFYFNGNTGSAPIYIVSFIGGCVLSFTLAETIGRRINIRNAVIWFAITFIITNFLFSQANPDVLLSARYSGAASNPNQLLFYASSLTLLLVIYDRIASIVYIPFIIFFMLKVGSDAYILSLIISVLLIVILFLMFKLKSNYSTKIFLFFSFLVLLSFIILFFYSDTLGSLWINADEGNTRTTLMYNALIASLKSPLFGYGAGSFSSYENWYNVEAHNTFLDFSIQFGFLFPIIMYYIFFKYLSIKFRNKKVLDCAFFVAFVISGLFHFSGRHFIFWVELGVFMNFIYFSFNQEKNTKISTIIS